MSKKFNNSYANEAIMNGDILKGLFEKYPKVSIRKLANTLKVTYGLVLQASKKPVAGETYNPVATNWDAVSLEFAKRGKSYLEDDVDWSIMNEGRASSATLIKDIEKFEIGTKVYIRKNNTTPYTIVYKTDTHIVIMLEGTTEPQSWSHSTFLYNGPAFEPREERIEEVETNEE